MTAIGSVLLANLLAYLINLAANERSSAVAAARERKLKRALAREEALQKALASARPIREEVRAVCIELARNHTRLGVTPQEEPLWRLLADDCFQADLAEWLMAGGIDEGTAAKERLLSAMELALSHGGASPEQIGFLRTGYFDALDKAAFANPILARWRHQLSLDYLREQVAVLRRRAEEAAGVYSAERQKAAVDDYSEKALGAWDIIDLSNLPEGDIHMATQKLLLRQLYMPLRIEVEPTEHGQDDDAVLASMEEQRQARRYREAGHLIAVERDRPDRAKSRSPVGERLGASRRLVVLGDPGGGKTTMVRWMATAYLLRYRGDPAFSQVPDTLTLPDHIWIPVLIRCRDLGEVDLCRSFADFLTQHLNKTELLPEDARVMRAVILDRIAKGEVLLLIDGLDEITNPDVRMMFCQELERTAARYPDAPIVVTSRIVGYRDMPYRMGSGFEHRQIAELNREDKDLFARRWVEVTEQHQTVGEKAKRARELLDALHSNDRIERLTGNPMLLTTLALVKRKVGKLPNKRSKLYAEAVSVLLNWNPRRYPIIEEDEAIPQLEYLAYEMCRRGVQRLTEDEVLGLLDRLRIEYPNVRAIRRSEPAAFLALIEARSSILIKSGGIWQKHRTQEEPVWEFRHLTFQEYLAARALLDGRYPGRDKTRSLAEQVASLAGPLKRTGRVRLTQWEVEEKLDVSESWREALRLLVAECKDDDVDNVLLAILNPLAGEESAKTSRPRAVLAAQCLADEPNLHEETAQQVLAGFAGAVGRQDGGGDVRTTLDRAAVEIGASLWAPVLKSCLIEGCWQEPDEHLTGVGALWGMVEVANWAVWGVDPAAAFVGLVSRLRSDDRVEVLSAALAVGVAAFQGRAVDAEGLTEGLFGLLMNERPESSAAALALLWLNGGFVPGRNKPVWRPSQTDLDGLIAVLERAPSDANDLKRFLICILEKVPGQKSLSAIIPRIEDEDAGVRMAVIGALGHLGDKQTVAPLLTRLDDSDADVRRAVIQALEHLGDKKAVAPLLTKLDDPSATVRRAVIQALEHLGDKKTVGPLLTKLDDPSANVRRAVIQALGHLGDKQAVAPLLTRLDDSDADNRATMAAVLHALGEPKGTAALKLLLTSADADLRQRAVGAYASHKDISDQRLLSRDLDAARPWLDPQEPITEARVTAASSSLPLTPDQVRSRYEAMALDLGVKLSWRA